MTERFDYEVALGVDTSELATSIPQLQEIVNALVEMEKAGESGSAAFRELAGNLRGSLSSVEDSPAFSKLTQDIAAAEDAWRKLNTAAATRQASPITTPEGGLAGDAYKPSEMSAERLLKLNEFLTNSTKTWQGEVRSLAREYQASEVAIQRNEAALKAAQDALASGRKSRAFEEELRGLSELEAATARLDAAERERNNAARQLARAEKSPRSDALERQIAATQRLEKAEQAVAKAREGVARATSNQEAKAEAAAKKEQAQQEKLATSLDKVAASKKKLDTATEVQDADRLTQATAKLSDAQDKYAAALQNAERAKASGDTNAQIAANNQLTTATNELTSAVENHVYVRESEARAMGGARYMYYDVARSATVAATALAAVPVAAGAAAISFEAAFADVRRTTGLVGEEANELRQQFVALSQDMPVAFGDISEIGTLAGQLGIANERVAAFSDTTARFVATTNVALDDAATAFGRLDALIPGVNGNFEALGSSILNVGINSVATESEIISQASQLAAIAQQAGLTADEIIGLSGAFASLGTSPETARSTMIRFYNMANEAVVTNNENLALLAKTAGMTGEEFQAAFREDFMTAFLGFLDGLNTQGSQAIATIREMGLTSVRDGNNLARLSQNVDFLRGTLADSSDGFYQATVLADNYGIIAETTAARLEVLWQNFQALGAAAGDASTGPLKAGIEVLITLLKLATDFASTPFGQVFITAAGGVALFVAAAASMVAVLATARAGMTTLNSLGQQAGATSRAAAAGQTTFTKALFGTIAATERLTIANTRLATSKSTLLSRLAPVELGMRRVGASAATTASAMTGAAGATAAFGAALRATGIGALAVGGIWLLTEGVTALSGAMMSAEDRTREFFGGMDGYAAAILADNESAIQSYQQALEETTTVLPRVGDEQFNLADAISAQASAQEDSVGSIDAATEALREQDLVLGETAEKWMQNFLLTSEAAQGFRDLFSGPWFNAMRSGNFDASPLMTPGVSTEGFDFSLFSEMLVNQAGDDAHAYVTNFFDNARAAVREQQGAGFISFEMMVQDIERLNALEQEFLTSTQEITGASAVAFEEVRNQIELNTAVTGDAMGLMADDAEEAADRIGGAMDYAGMSVEEFRAILALGGDEANNAFAALVEAAFAGQNAAWALEDSLYNLGASFYENGAAAFMGGDAIATVMEQIFLSSSNSSQAAGNMIAFYNALIEGGYATAQQLESLRSVIAALLNEADGTLVTGANGLLSTTAFSVPKVDFSPFLNGFRDMANSARRAGGAGRRAGQDTAKGLKEATKEVRTLLDYAKDLQGVFSRAFDLRFGSMLSRDSITSTFIAMREAADESAKSIRDLQQKIKELRSELSETAASISQQEYFLSIATEYGDTLRAEAIEAELLKLRAQQEKQANDLADAQDDLSDAQAANSKTLKGNSKQAIANRKTVTDLVSEYQEHIRTLAASGMSQKDLERETARLRAEFVRQLTQMGYNRNEVMRYAASFDDMSVAIRKVPRNVTVTTTTNPALQALREFAANANKTLNNLRSSAGRPITPNVSPRFTTSGASGAGQRVANQFRLAAEKEFRRRPIKVKGFIHNGGQVYQVPGTDLQFYSSGGYTGRGGKYDPAGIVHKGEYVVPKHGVDQRTGLPKADYMNSLGKPHQGSKASYASGGYVRGGNSGMMVVELSAADRRALSRREPVVVNIGDERVARAANAANFKSARRGAN